MAAVEQRRKCCKPTRPAELESGRLLNLVVRPLQLEVSRWLRSRPPLRRAKALDKGNAQTNAQVRRWMRHWQADGSLAGVRARDALARLPDEERERWERLWSDV